MRGSARFEHARRVFTGEGIRQDSRGDFRHDIQGLRAVAVLLVLAFHLWPDSLTGGFIGVDVFFVISGFLITAHLLQHPPRGRQDLLEFWGRRIRRLLPAAFLVLAATAIATRLIAPETRWAATAGEIIASALYVQNWVLAGNSVNYLLAEVSPTPVQHYWSLAVEEQFYLVWPVLILAVFWFAGRSRLGSLAVTRAAMLAVVAVSLYISITATAAEPASAYFITPTRVWELAVGGFVATLPALSSLRLPGRSVDGTAWLGMAMVVIAAVVISAETPFPGEAALLPVLGTALVILAATEGPASPTRLLRNRPIQHLGDTSYSIYLWHWPLIVLWPYAVGPITLVDSLVILLVTVALATLTKLLVEDPFRYARSFQALKPTFRFAAVGMLALSVVGSAQLIEARIRVDTALAGVPDVAADPGDSPTALPPAPTLAPGATLDPGSTPQPASPTPTPGLDSCIGAAAIVRGFTECPQDPAAQMVPKPVIAATDLAAVYGDGCWNYAPFGTRITCQYGNGDVRIALVGNSHAGHWLPTLQVLAKKHGWRITTYLASQCNATDAPLEFFSAAKTEGCLAYGRWAMAATRGDAFDLVITSERQSVTTDGDTRPETRAVAVAGYSTYLTRWSDAGTKVLILRDTPFPGRTLDSVPDCLAQHPTEQTACGGTPETWRSTDPLVEAAAALGLPGVATIDTMRFFCTETVCPAVIGTVVTYIDRSHITATYARSIAPFIEADILAALGR